MALSVEQRVNAWPLILLAVLVLAAWYFVFRMDADMREMIAMDMPMPASRKWNAMDFLTVAGAWSLMMAAMMVPASWPLLMILRRYGATTLLPLVLGYITVWTAFSLLATVLQWGLTQTPWFDPLHQRLIGPLGALILFAAALYQWSSFKQSCLNHCQSPFTLLLTRFRRGFRAAFDLGLYHGTFCVGCCWMLMLVLFAVGAMDAYWALALAIISGLERILPSPLVRYCISAVLGGGALWLLLQS